jgi:hypothetical protein
VRETTARRSARYVYLSDAEPHSSSRGRDDGGDDKRRRATNIAWRIVAANNRPLGRSAAYYPTLAACAESARTLRAAIGEAVGAVSSDIRSGHWRWTLSLEQIPVATCVHAYERRVECARALTQFIEACRVADPSPDEVRHLGSYALHGYPTKPATSADPVPIVAG